MSRYVFEENTTAWWVSAISNIAAPTAAEVNAGTNLTSFVTKDGLKYGVQNNMVSIAAIDTAFDAEVIGSYGVKFSVDFLRDDTTDTAWTTLVTRKTNGFFVVRIRGALPTAVAATGQKLMVFPSQTGQLIPNNSAANEKQKFTCEFAVTSTPNLNSAVA
jgi:hypothetical protein